jgi:ribonuclease D
MPEAIWIDRDDELRVLAEVLVAQPWIGIDTEFMRERTFYPRLCLLQISAGDRVWCVDTLCGLDLGALLPALTGKSVRKVIHAARQDLEAFYVAAQHIVAPVFDTQIAAACAGLKPQVGYADLANSLLGVTLAKGQTRTDWSRRPLSRAQLEYAADDVVYLGDIAARLEDRLRELGREHWVSEDCALLENPALYATDPALAWERLRGIAQLSPQPRARARIIAAWRENVARERNLPRSWVLPDTAIFDIAHADPAAPGDSLPPGLFEALRDAAGARTGSNAPDDAPAQESRPTAEQKALIERLARIVDARAAELSVSAEILAPRGELKALALGKRDGHALHGWRREVIGDLLLEALR